MDVVLGLYVNVREVWRHREGALRDARMSLNEAVRSASSSTSSNSNWDDGADETSNANQATQQ